MTWIFASAILGGLVVGFMAGASPAPTGGNVAAAVAALQLGVFGLFGQSPPQSRPGLDTVGRLFVVFLLCLAGAYLAANRLRTLGKLSAIGIGRKPTSSGPKR